MLGMVKQKEDNFKLLGSIQALGDLYYLHRHFRVDIANIFRMEAK